ncbi:MAG: response regulator transcription factor [Lachnospiraceae bacterium]|jgi:two-component system vancomycin resistance associated response regulator VraR|nr:response regulator transcription factor [Lachnospiraceae bacterium]MCH4030431.1 response regulator transcription factor [Lachnospiraceae bacterium]MCH4069643.1 response regulator transcription factor [Lachnospiraceae bacterium]MCH4107421.1 response regulator transcription factor [Lachnospiraceae bacterium]MCI1301728.1 response regulator transcription factor [Lachnospiraceae bacterium]
MKPYRVLVVEDQVMPRQLFEMFIQSSEQFTLAASIDSAVLADVYCAGGGIDLILMDVVTKNGANGLEAAENIKQRWPKIRIIIVTSMPECSYLERARKIGVDSFWYKEISREPILSLMERTMAGESVYPDAPPEIRLGLAMSGEFTQTELLILRELTGGYTDAEIGEHLHLSRFTVRDYVKSMREKTGFRSRTELAVKARQSGLVILEAKQPE